ncbi:MAG: xanthine dehydrogenase accessory protein XdhC [Phycisphaerales bacterium]|nr:xanthine dehydrogenase accessory protein XdhC [Phycisphaerales bacterium]
MSRVLGDYLARARELRSAGVAFVSVSLVEAQGHVPQDVGAKAIVSIEGLVWGTVGGGRLEARAIDHAREMLARADPRPESVRYELLRDLGMVCGGAATLYYEVAEAARWKVAVFGAGHVVQTLLPLVASFDCDVTCIDPRPEWISRLPAKKNVHAEVVADPAAAVRRLASGSFCLSITQGHATDLPVVRELLAWGEAAFIGVIGSEPKSRALRAALLQEGFSREAVAAIRCPLGLPIGRNDPAEIAVSIAAQLLQVRDELGGSTRWHHLLAEHEAGVEAS